MFAYKIGMDNISLIPKGEKEQGLPKFVSFKAPKIEFSYFGRLGLILILIAGLAVVGLFTWKFFLNKEVTNLDLELKQITEQKDAALERDLQNLSAIMGVFKTILDDHSYWTLFFKLLEERTLNTITFKSFNGDDTTSTVTMGGSAPSYGVLAQQIKVFENTSGVASAYASGITLSETGKVDFNIKITFNKEIIRKK